MTKCCKQQGDQIKAMIIVGTHMKPPVVQPVFSLDCIWERPLFIPVDNVPGYYLTLGFCLRKYSKTD